MRPSHSLLIHAKSQFNNTLQLSAAYRLPGTERISVRTNFPYRRPKVLLSPSPPLSPLPSRLRAQLRQMKGDTYVPDLIMGRYNRASLAFRFACPQLGIHTGQTDSPAFDGDHGRCNSFTGGGENNSREERPSTAKRSLFIRSYR